MGIMYSAKKKAPVCPDSRKCFAQIDMYDHNRCIILQKDDGKFYVDGECPFCKPAPREMTNEVMYPYDPDYGDKFKED